MRTKRVLSLLLTCAVLCGMLVLPTAADTASTVSTAFTDIADPEVAGAAETLRLLGIVNGTGGTAFTPERTLTRAEFCKMAVELMGNGDQVPAQMNRTIFKDVPATHWARGYIAVATQSTTAAPGRTPPPLRASSGETPTAISIRTGPSPMRRPSPFWCASWAMGTAMWEWCGPAAIWPRPMSWRSPTG